MTAVTTPPRPTTTSERGSFGSVLWAEWIKFRTVRGWLIGVLLAGLLSVLFAFVVANGNHETACIGDVCQSGHAFVPTGPNGQAVADSYQYLAEPLTGDGALTVQITALTGLIWNGPANRAPSLAHTQPGLASWAKAGILLTPNTTPGSAYAAVMVTGAHGVRFQHDYSHDQPGLPGAIANTSRRWLRLTRAGQTITGFDSTDAKTWHRIGATRLAGLPDTVDLGLFVTSPVSFHASNSGNPTQATATFDHITRTGNPRNSSAGTWQSHTVGTTAPNSFANYYPTLGTGSSQYSGTTVKLTGSGDIAPAVATLAGGNTVSDTLLFGIIVALIVLSVIATMFITAEYRRGLIRTTFTATPHRRRVLAAKALVLAAVAFVLGAIAAAAGIPLARHVLTANGSYIFPTSAATMARIIVGTGMLLAVTAVSVLALGVILRRSAGAVTVSIIVFVLPNLIGPGVLGPAGGGSAATWLYRATPAAGFSLLGTLPRSSLVEYPYTLANGYYPLPPWAGLAVLCAYAVTALAVASLLLRRRDA